jgi:hypothetical protein
VRPAIGAGCWLGMAPSRLTPSTATAACPSVGQGSCGGVPGSGAAGHSSRCSCADGGDAIMKRGPKPFGTGAHNEKIAEVAGQVGDGAISGGGQVLPEVEFPTPGDSRAVDGQTFLFNGLTERSMASM